MFGPVRQKTQPCCCLRVSLEEVSFEYGRSKTAQDEGSTFDVFSDAIFVTHSAVLTQ
jgi:hypothetical protein